jgi:hypothetical protein
MPASKRKKKTPGVIIPEVETELPPLVAMLEDVQQTLHHSEMSENTSPSKDAPLIPTRGKEAL